MCMLSQKERDYIKELKSKNEEMKSKIYSLRNQKMELDRRLLEMQSTIESLKDEQKTMEIAIEEKQNEIKMLKVQDQMGNEMENPQVMALVENLKHKEAGIEDLKHRLQYPEKVPSKSQVNNITEADQNLERSNDEAASDEDENGIKAERENPANKSEDSKHENVSLSLGVANSTGVVSDQNIVGKHMESEEFTVKGNGQLRKNGNSQGEGEENPGTTAKEGMELEIRGSFEKNDKRGSVSNNIKAKRWRLIAKNRRLENNGKLSGVTRLRSVRFYGDDNGELKSRVKRAASKGGVLLVEDNRQLEGRKAEDPPFEMTKKGEVSQESGRQHGDGDEDGDGISNEDYKEEIDESEF